MRATRSASQSCGRKAAALQSHIPALLGFLELLAKEPMLDEEVLYAATGLLGDLAVRPQSLRNVASGKHSESQRHDCRITQ